MGEFNINSLTPAQRANFDRLIAKGLSEEEALKSIFDSDLPFEGDVYGNAKEVPAAPNNTPAIFTSEFYTSKDNSLGKKILGGIGAVLASPLLLFTSCAPDIKQGGNTYNINNEVTIPIEIDPVDYDKLKEMFKDAFAEALADANENGGFNVNLDYNKIQEAVENALEKLPKPLQTDPAEIADAIRVALAPYFDQLNQTINQNGEDIGGKIDKNSEMLSTYMMTILASQVGIENAKEVAKALGITEETNPGFFKAMDVLKPRVLDIQATIEQLNTTVQGFNIADYSTILNEIKDAIGGINFNVAEPDLTALTQALDRIEAALNGLAQDVSAIKTTNSNIYEVIKNLPEDLKKDHQDIIEAIQNGTADIGDIKTLLQDIKGSTIDIKTLLENLPAQFAQEHQAVIDAINNGTAKAEDIRALVEAIKDDTGALLAIINNLPAQFAQEHQDVINAIKEGTAKAEDIRALVEAIKDDTGNIKEYTLSADQKLAILGGTVTNLYDDFAAYGPEVTDLLTQILNKIPEGCHCPDYTNVFAEIKVIIEQIKDKIHDSDVNDPHHEGILDDLDDIFA